MYGSNACDPVNGVMHGMMRFPVVGVVVLGTLVGGVAYKCFPGKCRDGEILVERTTNNDVVAVCVPKRK